MKQDEQKERLIAAMIATWLYIPDFADYSDDELVRYLQGTIKLLLNTVHRAEAMVAMMELFRRDNSAIRLLEDWGISLALDSMA